MPREKIDVERLLAEKAEAEAKANAAGQAIERHRAELDARRERREQEFDRGTVAEFKQRDQALLDEEKEAREAFRLALLDAPVIEAWIAQRSARWARVALHSEVQSASTRLDDGRTYAQLEPRDGRLLEDVVRLAEEAARQRGMDRIHAEITEPRDQHVYAEDES